MHSAHSPDTRRPWLEHYERGVPHTLSYPETPLYTLLIEAAQKYPERRALEFLGYSMTYRDLLEQARKMAGALAGLGVKKGDRVAIQLPNCPQYPIAFFGALMAGAIVVNTSPLYTPRELEHQLKDSGAETLITLNLLYPRYQEVASSVPVKRVIVSGIQEYLPFPKNWLYPVKARREGTWVSVPLVNNTFAFKKLIEKSAPLEPVPAQPDEVALLQYTGGTTGTPKGAMLTHRNMVSNVHQAMSWYPALEQGKEVMLAVIPFFHVYGMTCALNFGIASGSTLILQPRFVVADVLNAIGKQKPTLFPGVATMYTALNNAPGSDKVDFSSIRACFSGAAALPVEVAQTFEKRSGGKLVEGYGLTEAAPISHINPMGDTRKPGKIGLPLPGIDMMIVDDQGVPVAEGQIGELAISGPNVMQGYWQRPDETQKCIVERPDSSGRMQRWLLTGDMATLDAEGFTAIVDRKKDLIIAGGFNIYPREVEEVLYEHPAVKEAVVAGVPDGYRGETVKAYVVLREGASATPEEIVRFCKDRLSPYKVPKHLEFRTELPKTPVGKILRRALIEEEKAKQAQAQVAS